MFALGHVIVEQTFRFAPGLLPIRPSLQWELPFSIVDAFTRSALLCTFAPPVVLEHKLAKIRNNPFALVMTGMVSTLIPFLEKTLAADQDTLC